MDCDTMKDERKKMNSFTEALKDKYCIDYSEPTVGFIIVSSPKRKSSRAQQQAELAHLKTVVLNDLNLTRAGIPEQGLVSLCPNVVDLDLDNNMFTKWSEVLEILSHLPRVKYVNLSRNGLVLDNVENLPDTSLSVENLVLNSTGVTIEEVMKVSTTMPKLKELHLCGNDYEHLSSFDQGVRDGHLSVLECIRLNKNRLNCWSEVWKLRHLPQLKHLILSGNPLDKIFYKEECHHDDDNSASTTNLNESTPCNNAVDQVEEGDVAMADVSRDSDHELQFQDISSSSFGDEADEERPYSRDDGYSDQDNTEQQLDLSGNSGCAGADAPIHQDGGVTSSNTNYNNSAGVVNKSLLEEEEEWRRSLAEGFLQEIIDSLVEGEAQMVRQEERERAESESPISTPADPNANINISAPVNDSGRTPAADNNNSTADAVGQSSVSVPCERLTSSCDEQLPATAASSSSNNDNLNLPSPSSSTVAPPFHQLESLCLSEANISHWKTLLPLKHFPSLTCVRMLENPLYSSVHPDDRRKLYISSLPKVKVLNGSEVTDTEREKAERHYLRHYMDDSEKPDFFHTLVEKHGPPVKLVDIDLSAGYQEWVSLKFTIIEAPDCCKRKVPSFVKKVQQKGPMRGLKVMIMKELGLPSNYSKEKFTITKYPGPAHPHYEREPEELNSDGLPISRFDFRDEDEIVVDFSDKTQAFSIDWRLASTHNGQQYDAWNIPASMSQHRSTLVQQD